MNKDIEYKERRDKVSIDEEVMIKMEYHGKPANFFTIQNKPWGLQLKEH